MQCLFIFCYSKRQRAKTTPQICFHVFLLVVRWFVLNANPFALAPTHQSNWIRYHMDSCCELWCARTQHKEKSPRKAKTKKHKNVQRMHLLDGQKICTVQIACVISMSRYFATIKNRCHLPSRRLVHILISLHYRLLHLILLVSLSFFAVCIVYTVYDVFVLKVFLIENTIGAHLLEHFLHQNAIKSIINVSTLHNIRECV